MRNKPNSDLLSRQTYIRNENRYVAAIQTNPITATNICTVMIAPCFLLGLWWVCIWSYQRDILREPKLKTTITDHCQHTCTGGIAFRRMDMPKGTTFQEKDSRLEKEYFQLRGMFHFFARWPSYCGFVKETEVVGALRMYPCF